MTGTCVFIASSFGRRLFLRAVTAADFDEAEWERRAREDFWDRLRTNMLRVVSTNRLARTIMYTCAIAFMTAIMLYLVLMRTYQIPIDN